MAVARRETYVDYLGDAVISSAVALQLGSLIASIACVSLFHFGSSGFDWSIVPEILFVAIFACLVAALPTVLVGAPTYAVLAYIGWGNYLSALIIGLLVGGGLLNFLAHKLHVDPGAPIFVYLHPSCIALLTHYFALRRRMRRLDVARSGVNQSESPAL